MHVRERPPLRHAVEIVTPGGQSYRWADDEREPGKIPSGLRHSSTMPGGFETLDCVLARDPARPAPDLERLSTVTVRHVGGEIVGEYRLERAPRTSGDRLAISPSAVGWQAHLDDDKSAAMVYLCRDVTRWGPIGAQARILYAGAVALFDPVLAPDTVNGRPTIRTVVPSGVSTVKPQAVAVYDAGSGNRIGTIYARWDRISINSSDANYLWRTGVMDNDSGTSVVSYGPDLRAAGPGSTVFSPATPLRYGILEWRYIGAGGFVTGGSEYAINWSQPAVVGPHGLTIYGTFPDLGVRDGDVVSHAIARWAPLLKTTDAGGQPTVSPSTFLIPHLAFYDRTTAGEIVKQSTRFALRDWAVWENKTFWLHDRGARGRSWRARVGPSGLEEAGPQFDRVWESVIVAYRDVDGSTRTVGPPGSGTDVESALLKDADPDNPANRLGTPRRDLLQMGVGTATTALAVGQAFLSQAKLLDTSGRARLAGHVLDDRGVLHPYSHVRAGDTISFVDASDTSLRRIVKADHNHDERAVSIDLDAPPEGLQALLERLGVVLVPLGL